MDDAVTFSRNITLSLTRACAYHCRYCDFREDGVGLVPETVIEATIRRAVADDVSEVLLLSGEHPDRVATVRADLARRGFARFIDFAVAVCNRLLAAGLLPHANVGVLAPEDQARLRAVNASTGLMLENINAEFGRRVHPQKEIAARVEHIAEAGRQQIPFTSGILMGMGETQADRLASLDALADLHARYDHLQEIILQPYVPNRSSTIDPVPVTLGEFQDLIIHAHSVMPDVAMQIPPNLTDDWPVLIAAGANDLGGISSEGDHVNRERPWAAEEVYRARLAADGRLLRRRLPVYRKYVVRGWADPTVAAVMRPWLARDEFRYYAVI